MIFGGMNGKLKIEKLILEGVKFDHEKFELSNKIENILRESELFLQDCEFCVWSIYIMWKTLNDYFVTHWKHYL